MATFYREVAEAEALSAAGLFPEDHVGMCYSGVT